MIALEELNSLNDQTWNGGHIIDMWLLDRWHTAYTQSSFRYITMTFAHPRELPDADEVKHFRLFYPDLPQSIEEACPPEDFILVYCLRSVHYFTMVFTLQQKRVHIMGMDWRYDLRRSQINDWQSVDGARLVERMCLLYGWDYNNFQDITVNTVNWVAPNSYDCGPKSCQIIEWIWNSGLHLDREGLWNGLDLRCCHGQRRLMATRVHALLLEGYRLYLDVKEMDPDILVEALGPLYNFIEQETEMENMLRRDRARSLRPILENLRVAILSCQQCHGIAHPTLHDDEEDHQNQATILKGTRSKQAYVMDPGDSVPLPDQNISDSSNDDESDTEERHPVFQVEDWKEARIGRYPRPKKGPTLPPLKSLHHLRHSFFDQYDDYERGPTLDILDPIPETVMQLAQLSLVYIAKKVITAPWTLFQDYGFRLLPDFMQMFLLGKPILVKEHLCPIGLQEPPIVYGEDQPVRTSRTGQEIIISDRRVCGAAELLGICDEMESDLPLLTGKDDQDNYICLDLQRDHVIPQNIRTACDIDSLIWVTQCPEFKGFVNFSAAPVIRDRPPIWKNNHVMVELLYPQSEDDKLALGPRMEWQTKKFRLSRLPHVLFGHLDGTKIDLILFFPRMTHQHPHTKRWANAVPPYVQNLFWDNVFLPAVKTVLAPVDKPYVVLDREHSAFKGAKLIAHTFDREEMRKIVKEMKDLVSTCGGCLAKLLLTFTEDRK